MADHREVILAVQEDEIPEYDTEADFDSPVSRVISAFAAHLGLPEDKYELHAVIALRVTKSLNATLGEGPMVELKIPKQMLTLVLRPKGR